MGCNRYGKNLAVRRRWIFLSGLVRSRTGHWICRLCWLHHLTVANFLLSRLLPCRRNCLAIGATLLLSSPVHSTEGGCPRNRILGHARGATSSAVPLSLRPPNGDTGLLSRAGTTAQYLQDHGCCHLSDLTYIDSYHVDLQGLCNSPATAHVSAVEASYQSYFTSKASLTTSVSRLKNTVAATGTNVFPNIMSMSVLASIQ